MPDLLLAGLSDFHFLRPAWLLLVPLAALLYVLLRRQRDARRAWRDMIAPHLLKHLTLEGGRAAAFRPEHLIALVMGIGGLAMAGPTWSREKPPFADDQAALVIAIDASETMNAVDVPPTRLERAKQKVTDLLALRPGAKTGLIAYAGSAHLVLPLTEDAGILEMYVEAIATDVMPDGGKRPADALMLATSMLEAEPAGSILFLTDGVPAEDRAAFARHARERGPPVLVLGIGTSRGGPMRTGEGSFVMNADGTRATAAYDREGLDALARDANATVTGVTVDDGDVRRVAAEAEGHLADVQAEDAHWRWKDYGRALLFPLLLLMALWFRRGWTVRWLAVLIGAALWSWGSPAQAHESSWQDVWLTQDQQGRRHYERGEYEDAAAHFEDPLWRGIALYEATQYDAAVEAWAVLDTAEAWFRQGNAYARLERWDDALHAYREALERAPSDEATLLNVDLVKRLKKHEEEKEDEEPQEGGDTLGADEVKEADPNDKTKRPEVEEQGFGGEMDESMAEVWMRQVQTTPAEFLRSKFRIQAQEPPPRSPDRPKARRDEEAER